MTMICRKPYIENTSQSLSSAKSLTFGLLVAFVISVCLFVCGVQTASAKQPSDYAASSVLATGKWVKISVKETGMQTLSYSRLRSLGFADPSKVNVYGYGGRMIADYLDDSQIDDLPMQPLVRLDDAILFYGVGNEGRSVKKVNGSHPHVKNAYSEDAFYFLSDRPADNNEIASENRPARNYVPEMTSFEELLVHEKDDILVSNMTRAMGGEDFRMQNVRQFPFDLKGLASGEVKVRASFYSITSAKSTLLLETDAESKTASIDLSAVSGERVLSNGVGMLSISAPKEKLNVKLTFRGGGVVSKALLDFIEVYYPKNLHLSDSFLTFSISGEDNVGANVRVRGLKETSQIWDVTDPGHPVKVSVEIQDGTTLFFSAPGYREYVAFNPAATALSPDSEGQVANQDLHALPVPDMVIISPAEYMSAAERLADLHRNTDGMRVHIVTPESLYMEFSSGVRDLGAFRKAMKMWYDRGEEDGHSLKYCVLMGRTSNDCKSLRASADGITYPVMLSWQNLPSPSDGSAETSAYTTDDYIAMLDDSTPDTFVMDREKVRIAMGRFPVKSVAEANSAIDKLESYMNEPRYGSWRNRVLIIADNGDGNDHLTQGESIYTSARNFPDGKSLRIERLYLDSYPVQYTASGKEYTEPRRKFYDLLDKGVQYINYLGHANTRSWTHERLMLWDDLTALRNKHLPVILAATCEFGRWDDTSVSGAETMWLNPNGGAIAFIATNRKVWVSDNGDFVKVIGRHQYERDKNGNPKRLGDFLIESKNDITCASSQRFRYNIIGDPALKMPVSTSRTEITAIEGADMDANGRPVVKARSKFKAQGRIADSNGEQLPDFNGTIEFTLYDAEVVINTFGEPNTDSDRNTVPTSYNDRKTSLYSGKALVRDGKFEFTVPMPAEIDNNYSPALITLYAYSDDGREANGSFEEFYVYGYDTDAEEDTEGPVIERFTLNSDKFEDGDVTHETPVVYASISDPSGINLSEGGIGHKLSLVLDDTIIYDNVAGGFSMDPTDYTRGSLAYILPAIEPGEHTLKLTAWDNANNVSSATLNFKVGLNRAPALYDVIALTDKSSSSVTFILRHDRPEADMVSTVEVFDLNGRLIWSGTTNAVAELESGVRIPWNLTDSAGERVPRGIYIYKATVTTPQGVKATKSKKMAVGSPR